MPANTLTSSRLDPREMIDKCVEFARSHGVGEFPTDRRSRARMLFSHPVRYCLDSVPCEAQTHPGYTLNISRDGIALCSRQGIARGQKICLRLPMPDGTTTWLSGEVVHCEPEEEHYRVGITFGPSPDRKDGQQ